MNNRELFTLDPQDNNLLNDGVVEINTTRDTQGLKVIHHEIKTFVCEGEYQRGIFRILDTYLKHIDQPKQPAVWVSGFFGSGKSHLVKMLGYLWEDFKFPNGDTARAIKPLPSDVGDLLVELGRKEKLHGTLSISGTLKDFPTADCRYSFLQLLLTALGLPTQYHHFKFVHWAMKEGIYDDLKAIVESKGKDFKSEYENLFVSSTIAQAVLELRPEFAENEAKVRENFKANFKRVEGVNRVQMIATIRDEVLPLKFGNKIPCTIIVLDELQQFIGQDSNKTIDIQNLAQDICSNFDGKFLLVATGQSALSDTPQLQPLQDRFSVKVSLSDTDVETVTRKTVLEKKPSVIAELTKRLDSTVGEISRNLSGTEFGYLTADRVNLVADYPILPSTRKFWKRILLVIDKAGTLGQLRSQLRIVDESLKRVATLEVGKIIPADFVFEQKQPQLLQNALLLNDTNNLILERKAKGGDHLLEGRILSAVFLIDQLPKDMPGGRIKSNETTIADLLLDDLNTPSDPFRTKVKDLVRKLVDEQVLMPIDDEFKLQTKVGSEWEQEFRIQINKLTNAGEDQIAQLRREKIFGYFKEKTKGINILHGTSRLRRDFEVWTAAEKPSTDNKLNLWVRDGWYEQESTVMNELRSAGADTPLAYAYVHKKRDTELREAIIKFLAASSTLHTKGLASSLEAEQAQKSMETRKGLALLAINELVEKIAADASIFLAGGNKVDSGNLLDNAKSALDSLADRQFPDFRAKADFADWDKALNKALAGDPDPLKRIGYDKDGKDHPMAIEILRFIGNKKLTGRDIRANFMRSPYGWSQDAIDTLLLVLTHLENLSTKETGLNQTKIGKAEFEKEVHTLTALHKIEIKKLYLDAGINCKPNEEFLQSLNFLNLLKNLAAKVSGSAPLPKQIPTAFLQDIQNLDGNARLLSIYEQAADLKAKLVEWRALAEKADQRQPSWELLSHLKTFLNFGAESEALTAQVDAIEDDRLLLHEPDLVAPLLQKVSDFLWAELNARKSAYNSVWQSQMADLQTNAYFEKLTPEEKHLLLVRHNILHGADVKKLDSAALLNSLRHTSLDAWNTKLSALPSQFQAALAEAVKMAEPKAQTYALPRRTISTQADLEAYLKDLRADLEEKLAEGNSVILQ